MDEGKEEKSTLINQEEKLKLNSKYPKHMNEGEGDEGKKLGEEERKVIMEKAGERISK